MTTIIIRNMDHDKKNQLTITIIKNMGGTYLFQFALNGMNLTVITPFLLYYFRNLLQYNYELSSKNNAPRMWRRNINIGYKSGKKETS